MTAPTTIEGRSAASDTAKAAAASLTNAELQAISTDASTLELETT